MFGTSRIYLDHASATPLRGEAREAMRKAEEFSGNPGAIHAEGVAARRSLETSREAIAKVLACRAREIVFTSGLTEANDLAILGFAQAMDRAGKSLEGTHWITSAIEHPSILECFAEIERLGGSITHVEPNPNGVVSPENFARSLRKATVFASIGWANSEIGTVQPIAQFAHLIRLHEKKHGTKVVLHSDAGQAPLYRAPIVHTLGVDLFSLGSGKLYGPRGIGALYTGKRVDLAPLIVGGGQERGLRAGTEAVSLAVGFASALTLADKERTKEEKRIKKLRDDLAAELQKRVAGLVINGDLKHSLPHMLNVSVPNIHSEYAVLALDRRTLALSTKAACSEGNRNFSHVVAALDKKEGERGWRARNTLRFSLGASTSASDVARAAGIVAEVLASLPSSR